LTQKGREALQDDRLAAIDAEIERRKTAQKVEGDRSRKSILDQLAEMGERLRTAPDWVEPTPEEQERIRQVIEAP
jgi:hypothetical protein